jgi:hypothetical protein
MSRPPVQQVGIVIGAATAVLILVAACLFLFTDFMGEVIKYPKRSYLGYMFLAYGIFRAARLYFQLKSKY